MKDFMFVLIFTGLAPFVPLLMLYDRYSIKLGELVRVKHPLFSGEQYGKVFYIDRNRDLYIVEACKPFYRGEKWDLGRADLRKLSKKEKWKVYLDNL